MYLHPILAQLRVITGVKLSIEFLLLFMALAYVTNQVGWLASAVLFSLHIGVNILYSILTQVYEMEGVLQPKEALGDEE